MKLMFDDTLNFIEHVETGEEIQLDSLRFYEFVENILTPQQLERFMGIDTARTFKIKKEKEKFWYETLSNNEGARN